MNRTVRALAILTTLTAGASAQQPVSCPSNLTMKEVITALGPDIRAQPVYAGGGIRGWRLYGARQSAQLTAHAINEGTMMTHVCGIGAREILAADLNVCCNPDASREFEATFQVDGTDKKVVIKRPG